MRTASKKSTPYPMRVPDHLLELADLRAAEEHVDRSTALRQLLYMGADQYVMNLLCERRISVSKAAELLNISTLAVIRKAQDRGVQIGASAEDYAHSGLKSHPRD